MRTRHLRINILHGLIIALWLGLGARLIYLQVIDYKECDSKARDNMLRQQLVPAARGLVYDCRGRVLARNVANFVIKVVPAELDNSERRLSYLFKILHLSPKRAQELLEQARLDPISPLEIKEELDNRAVARVAELQGETEGIYIDVRSWREYPYGCVGSHVLGYVGEIGEEALAKKRHLGYCAGEWIGQDGLEYAQESLLHGRPGRVVSQVDVSGKAIRQVEEVEGFPGSDLHLCLDMRLQRYAEAVLYDALQRVRYKNGESAGGAVVAMEPHTGFVRALASLPEYNPNWFSKGISSKRFNRLINDKTYPLLNRAVGGAYPPGSTFKLVTTAAALQEGVITPGTWFYCPGALTVNGQVFNCFVRSGHGALDLVECIAQSCDVAYYQMGLKLGLHRMNKYAQAFGIGKSTGVDLPGENIGNFPYPGWKEKVYKEKWFPGDSVNTAIGQGFVTASPLQLAVMTAAVANGGTVYRPQIIERIDTAGPEGINTVNAKPQVREKVPVQGGYLAKIRQGMAGTVSHGTASSRSKGLDMAGKTGTAENFPTDDNPRGLNHTWFTGFTPVDNPDLVVTVFLEKSGGYGGNMAAPVAFDVARKWKEIQSSKKTAEVKPVEMW